MIQEANKSKYPTKQPLRQQDISNKQNKKATKTSTKTMKRSASLKHIWLLSLVAIAFILPILLQHQQQLGPTMAEAKIAKKVLKKAKKYAWLLAPQRQKFYAIPFPFPLPVFVKRQHIYTQTPVIPRYVQQPYHGSSSDYGSAASADNYASMSSPMPEMSLYSSPNQQPASNQHQQQHMTQTSSVLSRNKNPALKSGGYLSQIASAIGYNYNPTSVGSRELVTKLLSGQAKIISPAALLSNLRPNSPSAMFEDQQSNKNSASSSVSSGEDDSSSSSGSSKDQSGQSRDNKTTNPDHQAMKQSASNEMFYSVPRQIYRHRPPTRMNPYMMAGYRYAGSPHHQRHLQHQMMMMMPQSSESYVPFAPFAQASHPFRIPSALLAGGGSSSNGEEYSSQFANELLDAEPQLMAEGSDVIEAATTGGQILAATKRQQLEELQKQHQQKKLLTSPTIPTQQQQQLGLSGHQVDEEETNELESLKKQEEQEQLMEAVHRIRLKAALLAARERQVAEANAATLTAHQMAGLPVAPGRFRLVSY